MKETIYTIPINEALDQGDGCPFCTLRRKLEADSVTYIMGAAMMEPDVRVMINETGFCGKHYGMMLLLQTRQLSLGLIMESRLGELRGKLDRNAKKAFHKGIDTEKAAEIIRKSTNRCYICNRIALFEENYYRNFLEMWQDDPLVQAKLDAQPYLCLHHTAGLLDRSPKILGKKRHGAFDEIIIGKLLTQMETLNTDVSAFCKSFDYRNAGKPLDTAQQTAVRRAIEYMSDYQETKSDGKAFQY